MSEPQPIIVNTAEGWLIFHPDIPHDVSVSDGDGVDLAETYSRQWRLSPTRPTGPLSYDTTRTVGVGPWKLNTPALHEKDPDRWPLHVDPADYDYDDGEFYDREKETTTETHALDLGNAVEIEALDRGLPDRDLARGWVPTFVDRALKAPELWPWLPGKLRGFRAHMADLLEAMPEVDSVYCKRPKSSYEPDGGPEFTVRMRWDPPRTRTHKLRGRKPQVEQSWATVTVPLGDVPLSIAGADLWDAAEKWEAAEAEWLEAWAEIGAAACGVCDGRGWVKTGPGDDS